MAIQYAATRAYGDYDATTGANIIAGLKAALESVGWTSAPLYAMVQLDMPYPSSATGISTFGTGTIWVASIAYSFATTLTQTTVNQVLTGATMAATIQNFNDALSCNPATKGTAYSNATVTPHPSFRVSVGVNSGNNSNAGVLFTATSGGPANNYAGGFAQNNTCSNSWAWAGNIPIWGGYDLQSVQTTDGLRCRLRLWQTDGYPWRVRGWVSGYDGRPNIESRVRFGLPWDSIGTDYPLIIDATSGRRFKFIVNPHAFFTWVTGTGSGWVTAAGGVIATLDQCRPLIVTAITNTSPPQVTTQTAHGLQTGDQVFLENAGASMGGTPDTLYTVTVPSGTTVLLNGADFSTLAAYSPGNPAVLANTLNQVARYCWSLGGGTDTYVYGGRTPSNGNRIGVLNGSFMVGGGNQMSLLQICAGDAINFGGSRVIIAEPLVYSPLADANGAVQIIGQHYEMVLIRATFPLELTTTAIDGHTWMCIGNDSVYSLWMRTA